MSHDSQSPQDPGQQVFKSQAVPRRAPRSLEDAWDGPAPSLTQAGHTQFMVKDSGARQQFASGSVRDTAEGKIKWSRITFGPMMRRWAQHLTTAEAKYPDVAPGVPNFSLISTDEELVRYKESAFRHFMSWFFDETDEDHAAAVMFNLNGVEIIKDKRRTNG